MADKRITQLNVVTTPSASDVLAIVNNNETKKITNSNYTKAVRDSNTPLTASGIILSGDIVPATLQGANLGSIDKPFAELYLQSGSISIESDTPGEPPALISNFNGNVDIKAAGFSITSASVSPFILNNQGQIKIQNNYQDPENEAIVQIIGNNEGSQSAAVNPGGMFQVTGIDGFPNRNVFDSYGGSGVFSQVILRNAAGTAANPTSTVAGIIGRVATSGYITDIGFGIEGATGPPASMNFYTPGYRSGSRETMIRFYATADNELDPNSYSAVIKAEGMEITGSLDISGSLTASLTNEHVWIGNSNDRNTEISASSLAMYLTSSFITPEQTGSFLISSDTGSLIATGSLSGSSLVFEKGDSTTFDIDLNPYLTSSFVESAYISIFSTSSQALITSGSEQVVTFTSQWASKGVTLVSGSEVHFEKAGAYEFNFVAQVENLNNETQDSWFWIKYNGSNFPNSATQMTLPARKNDSTPSAQLVTVSILGFALNDGDYVELYWTGESTDTALRETSANGPVPEIPSVIGSIKRVG